MITLLSSLSIRRLISHDLLLLQDETRIEAATLTIGESPNFLTYVQIYAGGREVCSIVDGISK